MKLYMPGIDLGKTVFRLVGLDSTGKVVIRKRCSRTQLLAFTANSEVQVIEMEACTILQFPRLVLLSLRDSSRIRPWVLSVTASAFL